MLDLHQAYQFKHMAEGVAMATRLPSSRRASRASSEVVRAVCVCMCCMFLVWGRRASRASSGGAFALLFVVSLFTCAIVVCVLFVSLFVVFVVVCGRLFVVIGFICFASSGRGSRARGTGAPAYEKRTLSLMITSTITRNHGL